MTKAILILCCLLLLPLTIDAYQAKDAPECATESDAENTGKDLSENAALSESEEMPNAINPPPSAHWSDQDVGWGTESQDE